MLNLRIQILCGLLLIVLCGFVYMQFRLNNELKDELNTANAQIEQMGKSINDSNVKQNEFSEKIGQLEVVQYNNQLDLKKKLNSIKSKPVEQQSGDLLNAYQSVLECIEKKSLGVVCEK